jgi:hypothetical protein
MLFPTLKRSALAAILALCVAPAASSQSPVLPVSTSELELREQRATFIGVLVPGGGHLYAGESGLGVALLVIGYGAPAAGYVIGTEQGLFGGGLETALIGVTVGIAAWAYGWLDADNAVRRVSRGREAEMRPAVLLHRGKVYPGLALRVGL